MRIQLTPATEITLLRWLRQGYIDTADLPVAGMEGVTSPPPATINSVAELIRWLENRGAVNLTVVVQSIGDITNSRVDNVNTVTQ